jgi:hypothetical protein
MSDNTVAFSGSVGAAISIVTFIFLHLVKPFFTAANHKRIRSICCGRTCVTSLDVEDTTPVVLNVLAVAKPPTPPRTPRAP